MVCSISLYVKYNISRICLYISKGCCLLVTASTTRGIRTKQIILGQCVDPNLFQTFCVFFVANHLPVHWIANPWSRNLSVDGKYINMGHLKKQKTRVPKKNQLAMGCQKQNCFFFGDFVLKLMWNFNRHDVVLKLMWNFNRHAILTWTMGLQPFPIYG